MQAVRGLTDHAAARAVEHFVGDHHVSPHGETVHEHRILPRRAKPVFPHAPVAMGRAHRYEKSGEDDPVIRRERERYARYQSYFAVPDER